MCSGSDVGHPYLPWLKYVSCNCAHLLVAVLQVSLFSLAEPVSKPSQNEISIRNQLNLAGEMMLVVENGHEQDGSLSNCDDIKAFRLYLQNKNCSSSSSSSIISYTSVPNAMTSTTCVALLHYITVHVICSSCISCKLYAPHCQIYTALLEYQKMFK